MNRESSVSFEQAWIETLILHKLPEVEHDFLIDGAAEKAGGAMGRRRHLGLEIVLDTAFILTTGSRTSKTRRQRV